MQSNLSTTQRDNLIRVQNDIDCLNTESFLSDSALDIAFHALKKEFVHLQAEVCFFITFLIF
jgi:hypothetical protein